MSCGAGRRQSSDLALLWLWCRPVAIAPIGPLAWERPYAAGAALEKAKRQNKKNQKRQKTKNPPASSWMLVRFVSADPQQQRLNSGWHISILSLSTYIFAESFKSML